MKRNLKVKPVPIPRNLAKAARKKTGLTQVEFCKEYRLALGTFRNWEQGLSKLSKTSRVYLWLIYSDHKDVSRKLLKLAK